MPAGGGRVSRSVLHWWHALLQLQQRVHKATTNTSNPTKNLATAHLLVVARLLQKAVGGRLEACKLKLAAVGSRGLSLLSVSSNARLGDGSLSPSFAMVDTQKDVEDQAVASLLRKARKASWQTLWIMLSLK